MSKTLVYVLVPYSVGPTNISDHANHLLQPHALSEDGKSGRYDYLCRLGPVFDDPITEGILPDKQKRALQGYVSDVSRLPAEPEPSVLVTPEGAWHSPESPVNDVLAVPWLTRYAALLEANPYCWVVAVWAHS